jgi:26S proteasome regulatory subunit T1
MFAIRARRKVATERDFLDAVEKVVRQGTKFSSTCVLFFSFSFFPYETKMPSSANQIYEK